MEEESTGLRRLIMGKALGDRVGEDNIGEELNGHLRGMLDLIPKVYGDSEPTKQALCELRNVIKLESVACKRAMLLYGMSTERELCDHWKSSQADGSAALAKALQSRVLPFVVQRFFKHSCQCPEAFVVLTMVLADMWEGEKLGNWPLAS